MPAIYPFSLILHPFRGGFRHLSFLPYPSSFQNPLSLILYPLSGASDPHARASIPSVKLRHIRVFLQTFAIGLAAVWIVTGLKIAWRDKTVDLPSASEDVLYVYPETDTLTSCCQGGGAGGGFRMETVENDVSDSTSVLFISSKPKAQYTDAARREHVEGAVVLRVTFLANGTIGGVYVIKGLGLGLNNEAIHAARQITFHPKTINGRPTSVTRTVQYNFNIY